MPGLGLANAAFNAGGLRLHHAVNEPAGGEVIAAARIGDLWRGSCSPIIL
jgi:hypothetical protein